MLEKLTFWLSWLDESFKSRSDINAENFLSRSAVKDMTGCRWLRQIVYKLIYIGILCVE